MLVSAVRRPPVHEESRRGLQIGHGDADVVHVSHAGQAASLGRREEWQSRKRPAAAQDIEKRTDPSLSFSRLERSGFAGLKLL